MECGFLQRRRPNNWALLPLSEAERYRFAETDEPIDEILVCFMEADAFDAMRVRVTIDCSVYIRRIFGHSPKEHMEMQQIIEARREAQAARASQRRDTWIIGGLTMVIVLAGSVVAALIGRGILFPPAG